MQGDQPGEKAGTKILSIIDELQSAESLGVTELADRVDIAKSTAHYHLDTLREEGYVVKEESRYRLSLRFLRLGILARNRTALFETAETEVEELAEETGELAILALEEQGMGVYLHKAAGDNAVDIDAQTGRFDYLHNRAFGKAILAHLDRDRVAEILDTHGLPGTTRQTITSREELFAELEEIRSRGFAINEEESIEGIHGVATPILDKDGSVLGAISLAGPSERMDRAMMSEEHAELLARTRNVVELNVQHAEFL